MSNEKYHLVDRRTLEVVLSVWAPNHTTAYKEAEHHGKVLDQRLFAIPQRPPEALPEKKAPRKRKR